MQVVWFKRDLRVVDHLPLIRAADGGTVLPLYVIEPDYWRLSDTAGRQWSFLRDCLTELRDELSALGTPLVVRVGTVTEVFRDLHQSVGIQGIWSHEENGNAWTYERDRAVAAWARQERIVWTEVQQHGVIRGLGSRSG